MREDDRHRCSESLQLGAHAEPAHWQVVLQKFHLPQNYGGVESGNHAEAERSIHHLLFQKFISKSPLPIVRYHGCVFIKNCKFGSVEATRE